MNSQTYPFYISGVRTARAIEPIFVSHTDRLERIIAKAMQAERLEKQLARECEKRQQLAFQLQSLQAKYEALKPEYEPVKEDELISIDKLKPTVEDNPMGFDWRSVSNDELNGDRRRDAYAEKLRRSVEAA